MRTVDLTVSGVSGYKYDLSEQMDGSWWDATQGEDFECDVNAFKIVLRYHAAKSGMFVQASRSGLPSNVIRFRFAYTA